MADIHMGEAVIDYNYSEFPNDSTRKMLKQSIYDAHGVDASTVDTSLCGMAIILRNILKSMTVR